KTHLNDHILEEYKISVPEYIESKGSSKWEIQGYVYKPVDYEVAFTQSICICIFINYKHD
ncbi:hypothetical protein ACTPD5_21055, partial [Clostridioides difficile]|uniref:hypothetical protein n=1 Tax=Clostridioides difficile TaxID=1496 RepID=UPI003F8D7D00